MQLLRFPRITALGIILLSLLLVIWSTGDLERPFSWERVRTYFNLLFAIIMAPSFTLLFILPRIANCRHTFISHLTIWILLTAFVVTIVICAITVRDLAPTTAFAALFYFLGVGIQSILVIMLAYTWLRDALSQPKRLDGKDVSPTYSHIKTM